MRVGKTVGAVVAVLALVVGIAIGGYHLNWWLAEDTTNRRTAVVNDSLSRQQALLDEAIDKVADVGRLDLLLATATPEQTTAIRAQRIAVVEQVCSAVGRLTGRLEVPTSVVTFTSQEC
jgi:hypothetical protein